MKTIYMLSMPKFGHAGIIHAFSSSEAAVRFAEVNELGEFEVTAVLDETTFERHEGLARAVVVRYEAYPSFHFVSLQDSLRYATGTFCSILLDPWLEETAMLKRVHVYTAHENGWQSGCVHAYDRNGVNDAMRYPHTSGVRWCRSGLYHTVVCASNMQEAIDIGHSRMLEYDNAFIE